MDVTAQQFLDFKPCITVTLQS